MIGISVGIFCTLIVAALSSYCFKLDVAWFYGLKLPSFMLPSAAFEAMVALSYLSCILAVGRLVEYKHIFPSMLFFAGLGTSSILFVYMFFARKMIWWGLFFMAATLAFAFVLFFRFLVKDFKMALEFLPAFLFDLYGFVVTLSIAMAN